MKFTDILPLDYWRQFERKINDKYGLNASVFDQDGMRITGWKNWANKLCPVVKANKIGQSYICALAHRDIATRAMLTRKPVVGECDAGLVKIAVPVFVGQEFLGVVGGCGRILNGSEVDTFLVNKVTHIDEKRIMRLSKDVSRMTTEEAEEITWYIQQKLDVIIRNFEDRISARVQRDFDAVDLRTL